MQKCRCLTGSATEVQKWGSLIGSATGGEKGGSLIGSVNRGRQLCGGICDTSNCGIGRVEVNGSVEDFFG